MTDERKPSQTVLDSASKGLALAAAGMLSVSVFYDYSYFQGLGLSFGEVPTTLPDHVRSALIWAPTCLAGMFVGGMYSVWAMSRKGPRSKLRTAVESGLFPMLLLAAFCGAAWVGAWWIVAYILVASAWLPASVRAIRHEPFRQAVFGPTPRFAPLFLFIVVPLLTISLGGLAYARAWWAIEHPTPRWQVILKKDSSTESRTFSEVRRFSAVAVAVGMHHDVHVFPADAVLEAVGFSRVQSSAAKPSPPAFSSSGPAGGTARRD